MLQPLPVIETLKMGAKLLLIPMGERQQKFEITIVILSCGLLVIFDYQPITFWKSNNSEKIKERFQATSSKARNLNPGAYCLDFVVFQREKCT